MKIKRLESDYKTNEKLLEKRLVIMYELGDVTYLEVLFNSASLMDFLSNYYTIQEIVHSDTDLLKQIQDEKDEVEKSNEDNNNKSKELNNDDNNQKENENEINNNNDINITDNQNEEKEIKNEDEENKDKENIENINENKNEIIQEEGKGKYKEDEIAMNMSNEKEEKEENSNKESKKNKRNESTDEYNDFHSNLEGKSSLKEILRNIHVF